jgi:ribosomal protein S12 methylthiotransferase
VASRFYVETLGCPKNEVDSEKIVGTLLAQGLTATEDESQADVVVVNTCAFIEEARKESIDTILALSERRKKGARLVVTGCMAERYGDELRANLPEADQIAGFGVAIALGKKPSLAVTSETVPSFDLLNLPRPKSSTPWAYVKIAEGCDRNCGFCAIRRVASQRDRAGSPGLGQLRQRPPRRTRRRFDRAACAGGERKGAPHATAVFVPE